MLFRIYIYHLLLWLFGVSTIVLAADGSSYELVVAEGSKRVDYIKATSTEAPFARIVDGGDGHVTYSKNQLINVADFHLQQIANDYPELSIGNYIKRFLPLGVWTDAFGIHHVEYKQLFQGIEFYGATVTVHLDEYLSFKSLTGRIVTRSDFPHQEDISGEQAERKAKEYFHNEFYSPLKELRVTSLPVLYLFSRDYLSASYATDDVRLVWKVNVSDKNSLTPLSYFIDAKTEELVFSSANVTGDRELHRHVYDCSLSGNCLLDFEVNSLDHILGRSEGRPARGAHPISGSFDVDQFYSGALSLDTFLATHVAFEEVEPLRLTFNEVKIYTHYDEVDSSNACQDRPSFNGETENGDPFIAFCTVAQASHLDTFGHEYAHFITRRKFNGFDANPDIIPPGWEAGAIAESFSDFIGEAYEYFINESNDWRLYSAGTHNFVRNMQNPTRSLDNTGHEGARISSPDSYDSTDFYCGSLDNGGVHINAGVLNKAFYLMVTGDSHNFCTMRGIGFLKAQRILYYYVQAYLAPSSTFASAYTHIVDSCKTFADADYFGITLDDCEQVQKALQSVKVDKRGGCNRSDQRIVATCAEDGVSPTPTPTPVIRPRPRPRPPFGCDDDDLSLVDRDRSLIDCDPSIRDRDPSVTDCGPSLRDRDPSHWERDCSII